MSTPPSPVGFVNGVSAAYNADFSGALAPALANGLVDDFQVWMGSTSPNANGTHINVTALIAGTNMTFVPGVGTLTLNASGGGGGGSSDSAFSAYLAASTGSVTGDGTLFTIPFDTTFFDNGSNFDTGTGQFIVPNTGVLHIDLTMALGIGGTSFTDAQVFLNTTSGSSLLFDIDPSQVFNSGANQIYFTGSTNVAVTAGDFAELQVKVSGGTPAVPVIGTAAGSTFSGFMVGSGGGVGSINQQLITTTGTYTPSANIIGALFQIGGGGAAGGGASNTSGGGASVGTGGGCGEIAEGYFDAATIGASQAVTIGAAGVPALGASGGNGGNTSVGSLISANGGTGGTTIGNTSFNAGQGGAGGTGGSGGIIRFPGAPGTNCFVNPGQSLGWSGAGGSSPFGAGGQGVVNNAISMGGFAASGNPASGFSSGGGGSLIGPSHTDTTGGDGSPGFVLITEYIA